MSAFFREPKIYWLPDRETESGESALRGMVVMEEQHPPRAGRESNEIFREEFTVPVPERHDQQVVRDYAMYALYRLCLRYRAIHPPSESGRGTA